MPIAATVCVLTLLLGIILTFRPRAAGPLRLLAAGICVQSVAIALVVVPAVGPHGAYAVLWKEAVVGLLLLVLFAHRNRSIARRLPVPILVVLILSALQLFIYAAFPAVATSQSIPLSGATARLAGLRQWLVPLELLLLGHVLHNAGLQPVRLLAFIKRFGTSVAAIAVVGWVVLPLTFWVGVNSVTSDAIGDDLSATGRLEGMQSYFLGHATPRAVAPFGSPLALAFSLLLPLCVMWAARRGGRVDLPLLLVGIALALTQTRGILFGIALVWLLSRLRAAKVGQLVVGAMTLAGLAVGPLKGAIVNTVTLQDPSSNAHYSAISEGYQLLVANRLGLGLGQGGQVGRVFSDSRAGGESLFLVAGNERGWLGLAVVVAWFIVCWTALRSRSPAGEPAGAGPERPEDEALRSGVRRAVAVLALASLTTEHAVAFTSTWLLWVAVGYVATSAGRPVVATRLAGPVRLPVSPQPRRTFAGAR